MRKKEYKYIPCVVCGYPHREDKSGGCEGCNATICSSCGVYVVKNGIVTLYCKKCNPE